MTYFYYGKREASLVLEDIENIQIRSKKAPEIWVRHDLRDRVEQVLERLKQEGVIISYNYRENYSCGGSANYSIQYPSS